MFFWGWSICSSSKKTTEASLKLSSSKLPIHSVADPLMASPLTRNHNHHQHHNQQHRPAPLPLDTISSPLSDSQLHQLHNPYQHQHQHDEEQQYLRYQNLQHANFSHPSSLLLLQQQQNHFQHHQQSSTKAGHQTSSSIAGANGKSHYHTNSKSPSKAKASNKLALSALNNRSAANGGGSRTSTTNRNQNNVKQQKPKRSFLFFLRRPKAAASGQAVCTGTRPSNKNLSSTSSLQHLREPMDNSNESIEIDFHSASSPDLIIQKKAYRDHNNNSSIGSSYRDDCFNNNGGDDDDDEVEFQTFLHKNRVVGGRRAAQHQHQQQDDEAAAGCCRIGCPIFGCFFAMHSQLKQFLARKRIEYGLKLYEKHNYSGAMRVWKNVIRSNTVNDRIDLNGEDLFLLLGYLYQACINFGKYFDAMEYARLQLSLSDEFNLTKWRSESYLNLSRVCEKLGKLKKALSYARHSLYNECDRKSCFTIGMVYLTVAKVYLEMGGFSRSLEDIQNSHRTSLQITDIGLELKCYLILSELFERLNDIDKSIKFASKSYDLSRSLQLNNLNTLDHRHSLLRMASALRKNNEFGDAQDYCNEAIRLSLMAGDQSSYIRSMRIMGDIYRKNRKSSNYLTVAFQQYEQSMGLASMIGDRMGQMEAMDGAARCLEILRLDKKICNCRPLEFNTRLLEVANSIGAKLLVRKIRSRLSLIYLALGDEEQHKLHKRLANQTELALGLICGVCNEKIGVQTNSLDVLPCSHILHEHCATEIYLQQNQSSSQTWKRSSLDFLQHRSQQEVFNCPACRSKYKSKKVNKKKNKKKHSPSRSSPPTPPLPPHHARHCNSLKMGATLSRQHSLPNCHNIGFQDEDEDEDDNDDVGNNDNDGPDIPGDPMTDEDAEDVLGDDNDDDELLLLGLNEIKKNFFFENPKFRNVDELEDELDVKMRELDNQHLHSYHHHRSHTPVLRNFCGQEQVYENEPFVYGGRDGAKAARCTTLQAQPQSLKVPPNPSRSNSLRMQNGDRGGFTPNGNLSLASINLRASSLTIDGGDCQATSSV